MLVNIHALEFYLNFRCFYKEKTAMKRFNRFTSCSSVVPRINLINLI